MALPERLELLGRDLRARRRARGPLRPHVRLLPRRADGRADGLPGGRTRRRGHAVPGPRRRGRGPAAVGLLRPRRVRGVLRGRDLVVRVRRCCGRRRAREHLLLRRRIGRLRGPVGAADADAAVPGDRGRRDGVLGHPRRRGRLRRVRVVGARRGLLRRVLDAEDGRVEPAHLQRAPRAARRRERRRRPHIAPRRDRRQFTVGRRRGHLVALRRGAVRGAHDADDDVDRGLRRPRSHRRGRQRGRAQQPRERDVPRAVRRRLRVDGPRGQVRRPRGREVVAHGRLRLRGAPPRERRRRGDPQGPARDDDDVPLPRRARRHVRGLDAPGSGERRRAAHDDDGRPRPGRRLLRAQRARGRGLEPLRRRRGAVRGPVDGRRVLRRRGGVFAGHAAADDGGDGGRRGVGLQRPREARQICFE